MVLVHGLRIIFDMCKGLCGYLCVLESVVR